jgi:hypothetical protein
VTGESLLGGFLSPQNRQKIMIIRCQQEWVDQCITRYRVEPPEGYHWENAHFPKSEKLGETNTIRLWHPDHIVQGCLQTLQFQHPCIDTRKLRIERPILEREYPEYLEVYDEAYRFCQSYFGKIGGVKGGRTMGARAVKEKIGIHDPAHMEILRENSRRNGKISGPKATSQRWQSTVDGFISHAPGVAKHNRHNGWDPEARIRIS